MSHCIRPLAVAATLLLACSVVQAKPAKQAAKPAAAPAASSEFELAHNLGPLGEDRLQALVDRFNKESGNTLKLVRLEKGEKPATLNLVRRHDMSDVLSQPKQFVPLHEVMAKAGETLNFGELSADLRAGAIDAKGRLVALPVI